MKHEAQFKQWFKPVSHAAALALLLAAGNAAALGLGSIHVRSNLGEAFSADIDINTMTEAEAESLRVKLADPLAYEAAGLEMSSSLMGAAVTLEKTPDGRSYLKVRGGRPVNDPFVDLLIQTDNTESGKATRGYTVLIDPPKGIAKAPKIAPPVVAAAPKTKKAEVKAQEATPTGSSATASEEAVKTEAAPASTATAAAPSKANTGTDSAASTVRVERGTTAGKIARDLAGQEGVSFDQMLAALLRQNPDAFIGGNVNRIKAGAVLQAPTAEQANSVSQKEAKKQWVASGNNFSDYRRRLAQVDSAAIDSSTGRSSSGSVEGEASDQASSSTARDKLTLGKAGARRGAEDKALRKRQRADASARQAELSKNIEDLKRLSGSAAKSEGAAAGQVSAGAGIQTGAALANKTAKVAPTLAPTAVPTLAATAQPTMEPTLDATALAAASAAAGASSPEAMASGAMAAASGASAAAAEMMAEPTAAPSPKPVVTAAPVAEESGLFASFSDWALPLGGLLGAGALAGLGLAFFRRRKAQAGGAVDSASFLESKLEADSFFDASGGQRVDTSSRASGISSSMVYSPSQLDAAGDVDPVAEAGVYMAYNRDQQAEDILKEAMRTTPSRVAIYTTLMEIYAKRGDLKAFDVVAREAHHLTGGQGEDWAKALELGRQTDPSNALFAGATPVKADDAEDAGVSRPAAAPTAPMSLEQAQASAKIESGDLDMVFRNSDFKLSESQAAQSIPGQLETTPMSITPNAAASSDEATAHMDLAFDLDVPEISTPASPDSQFTEAALSGRMPLEAAAEPLKFDMGDLSLDLSEPAPLAATPATSPAATDADSAPWLTKLELAREFVALGDKEGARAMAEEVVANAPAAVAVQARSFIATMV